MDIWSEGKLILFIAFVIPGFISIKVYEMLYPGEFKDVGHYLLNAVTYSCLNYALLSPVLILIDINELYDNHPIEFGLMALSLLFIFPILWVIILGWLRSRKLFKSKLKLPDPTAWDYIFRKRESYWIIIHLSDGNKIGGIYDSQSYTSGYPEEEQIYLEEVWELGENDEFLNAKERSKGILVSMKDIKAIEFLK
ncbi:MAG: DUF6338 family protein [Candidatus Omnitrophota bacterium]